jgi:ABC-type glycerol-3-phosphate transport system substrate-binding protein
MFVRDDIFKELDLQVPQTWDEYLSVIAVIQRKNMNAYLPYTRILAATTVNTGAGGLSIFPTLLMQNGESLYNKELNSTNLASPISVQTFKFWTDFYTEYKLNPDVNFYQRFRVGTIPLGIAGYTNYLTFAVAAPEIEGKWSVHIIPGVKQADGSVNHVTAGSGTGCAIMNSSKHKDAAWKFLKWWVSADTQYAYSFNCEAILGQSGRTATANIEALSRLSWDKNGLEVILDQWKEVKEIEEVPGSYYVSRSIDQAFWAVYNNTASEKEAITDWSKTSDNEIKRKIAEYAYRNK